jgi:hypothetical protein
MYKCVTSLTYEFFRRFIRIEGLYRRQLDPKSDLTAQTWQEVQYFLRVLLSAESLILHFGAH